MSEGALGDEMRQMFQDMCALNVIPGGGQVEPRYPDYLELVEGYLTYAVPFTMYQPHPTAEIVANWPVKLRLQLAR